MLKVAIFCAVGVFLISSAVDCGGVVKTNKPLRDSDAPDTLDVEGDSEINQNNEEDGVGDATCSSPPSIEGAQTPDLDSSKLALGTVAKYQCSKGYNNRIPGGFPSVCRINEQTKKPEWTKPDLLCDPRSCGDPGYVMNGRRIGYLFTFPNQVDFECDEGFKLRGRKTRYCQASGEWSGRVPTCEIITCSAPSDPLNGRASYSSLEYGSELRYECNRGFVVENHQTRVCEADGKWSNKEPECIEVTCEKVLPPERGSVRFSNGQSAGSLATYVCEEGTALVGSTISKCLDIGIWTFPPPNCLRSCIIPEVVNGTTGRFRTVIKNRQNHQVFGQFQVGETINHGESITLKCNPGFMPVSQSIASDDGTDEVSCNDGEWSKPLQCNATRHSASCLGDPPQTDNGSPVIPNNTHGSVIWYHCNNPFKKLQKGRVVCVDGTWKGTPPICGDSRCHTNQLNYPGLKIPSSGYFGNTRSFEIQCEEGYTKISSEDRIKCSLAKWQIESNPCTTINKCEEDPPPISNGRIEYFDRENGSEVRYKCNENFEMVGQLTVRCVVDKWEGTLPRCQESRLLPLEQSTQQPLINPIEVVVHHTTTQAPVPSISPADTCHCTYDYRTDFVAAYSGNGELNSKDTIKKGETVALRCLHPEMYFMWPNGLYLYETTINLTCDICQDWTVEDLPTCVTKQAGDSFLINTKDLKILPGGVIEIPKGKNVSFHCINFFDQPSWNPNDKRRTYVTRNRYTGGGNGGYSSEYLNINETINSHAGRYDCYYATYHATYRPTTLVLKIVETEVQCPKLQTHTDQGIFNVLYENDRAGRSIAKYTCKSITQKLIGESSRTCLPDGKWSGSSPSCEDITCPSTTIYNGLVVAYTNGDKVNSKATFRCSSKAKLVGQTSSICLPSGEWSNPRPTCEEYISCKLFEKSENLDVFYDNDVKVGSIATFSCADSYKLVGQHHSRCLENGTWSHALPSCEKLINCKTFKNQENLEVFYSNGVKAGSIATFSCTSPYTMVGSYRANCRKDGTWSHALPTCERSTSSHHLPVAKCLIDDLMNAIPEEVFPDLRDVKGESVPIGTELQFLCGENSFLSGSQKAKCGSQRRWEHEAVSCIKGCVMGENISPHLSIEPMEKFYRFGALVKFSCLSNLTLSNDIQQVMCIGTTWSDPIPDCVEEGQSNTPDRKERRRNG